LYRYRPGVDSYLYLALGIVFV